jgi:FMN phosphatase YigB (HAD superfamily)
MILLCDLDGTLLSNSMASFQAPYLKALGAYLSDMVLPDKMIPELLAGTRKMLENNDPLVTLESAFDQRFYPSLNIEKSSISSRILDFYLKEFPSLGRLTQQLPQAIEFVKSRLSSGDRVVVATNPLFPREATFARLVWAGLPVNSIAFELITTYEFMHFSKPHAAYYSEMLAYLGYPDEPVIMIGNDLNDDILAADKLGIPGFWLTLSEPIQGDNGAYHPSGTYQNLTDYLKKDFQPSDLYHSKSLPALAALLKGTLAALHTYSLLENELEDMLISVHSLIVDRYRTERIMVENSTIGDTLVFNDTPIEQDLHSDLSSFTRFRLMWLNHVLRLSSGDEASVVTGSNSLLESCIEIDRKLMMDCTQWFKSHPKFAKHPGLMDC